MKLSDEAIEEFMTIYRDEFNDDITREEAQEMASRVLALYKLLAEKLSDSVVIGRAEGEDGCSALPD